MNETHCQCGEEFPPGFWVEGRPEYKDCNGKPLCYDCWVENCTFDCPVCEEFGDQDDEGCCFILGQGIGEQYPSGVYVVLSWPFFRSGGFDFNFIESNVLRVGDLALLEADEHCENGSVCASCFAKVRKQVGQSWCRHFYGVSPSGCRDGMDRNSSAPMGWAKNVKSQCLGLDAKPGEYQCPKREAQ